MSSVYICDNKKFTWRVIIVPHLIDKEDVCTECGGNGSHFDQLDGISQCQGCYGKGKKTWHGPMFMSEDRNGKVTAYLQKCLEDYVEREATWVKANPPFIGMNI